jgi:amino acid adenylation domain-containing protein
MLPLGPDDGSLLGASADRIPEAHLPAGPRPDQAAYIIYTSGSTGMPKGVLGVHQGLAHFVDWQRTEFGIGPGDRVGLLTGYGFDVVLRDLFLPLTSGATLCLPEDEAPTDAVSWLDTQGITVLHTVPSLAQSWLADDLGDHRLSDMRWIFMAGEPLTGSLVADWRRAFPEAGRMVNLYGPTETTLAKSFYRVPTSCGSGVLPVGWPIPESQGLVLNDDMQPCGTGEAGEVYVRTPFRSRGYVSRPDETRLRFIDNPFGSASGDLLYRTGDRGHYRPDGALVVTGRLDDQVKIRGVRVEPAEVGAVLARHECVAAGTVQATTDEQGETSLVAYVVPNVDPGGLEAGLRAFLGKHLPSAMVPREFVWLERLPLLPTGKIDRTVLSSAQTGPVECTTASTPPRDELERRVAAIWATVLERDSVGVDADFFEIGGHSLLATRVLARINDAFGVSLPLRHLFESPTVAELCERLRAQPDTHRTVMEGMDKRPR